MIMESAGSTGLLEVIDLIGCGGRI
jgi:hypothetical protein